MPENTYNVTRGLSDSLSNQNQTRPLTQCSISMCLECKKWKVKLKTNSIMETNLLKAG